GRAGQRRALQHGVPEIRRREGPDEDGEEVMRCALRALRSAPLAGLRNSPPRRRGLITTGLAMIANTGEYGFSPAQNERWSRVPHAVKRAARHISVCPLVARCTADAGSPKRRISDDPVSAAHRYASLHAALRTGKHRGSLSRERQRGAFAEATGVSRSTP